MALLVLLFALYLSVSAKGRTWHNFNGFQYSIEMTAVNSYAEAEGNCSALQANVSKVKTTTIFEFLKSYLNLTEKPYSLYIGARKIENTDAFQWNDGSNVSLTTTMWSSGQPNHLKYDNCITMGYLYFQTSYRWWDVPCTRHSARYICEKNIPASAKPNTATIASAIGGCVILIIICIAIVVVSARFKGRRIKLVNEAVATEYNVGADKFEPEETYNIPQTENPPSYQQNDDVNHYDEIQESRHRNIGADEVAQPEAGSSDVYVQVRKSKQSTKVHDNGQQSHVRKYDHNQLDEVSYDTLQLSKHVEVHDQFASGSNSTDIYDNRNDPKPDSAYDELQRDHQESTII